MNADERYGTIYNIEVQVTEPCFVSYPLTIRTKDGREHAEVMALLVASRKWAHTGVEPTLRIAKVEAEGAVEPCKIADYDGPHGSARCQHGFLYVDGHPAQEATR